ncbi:MAG: bifunctional nuclease family protein [Cyanobacteria bacterium HKST-UBA04]|nr:bifunctional nuclease family protein [Cyanobacteria bacterium HKST-UBA04]MCA9842321.1 bifunctional nuclease family protein [Cyanobacteria bacterium HKST-UBA03]
MIKMYVMGIALDTRTGTPIVVLNDEENRRALPIWIGTAEASAIIRQLENIKSARPMTHDLVCNMIDQLGYHLVKVEINDLNADTYYANIYLSDQADKELIVDSRPSDAIALALRVEAPIYVTANVIADGTISTDQSRDEEEAGEFRDWLKDLKPADFNRSPDSLNDEEFPSEN